MFWPLSVDWSTEDAPAAALCARNPLFGSHAPLAYCPQRPRPCGTLHIHSPAPWARQRAPLSLSRPTLPPFFSHRSGDHYPDELEDHLDDFLVEEFHVECEDDSCREARGGRPARARRWERRGRVCLCGGGD